jgi:hypothetical protein
MVRTLIVCNIMSLDAKYEGPAKNVMVLTMDEAFDAYCSQRLRAANTLLLGRTTHKRRDSRYDANSIQRVEAELPPIGS